METDPPLSKIKRQQEGWVTGLGNGFIQSQPQDPLPEMGMGDLLSEHK
jgi:hypothetical protein